MVSPAEIWSSLANARGLGWRIANALQHLERRWPIVSEDFRRGINESRKIVDAFLFEDREIHSLEDVDDHALRFLAVRETLSVDELLAFLKIVDALLPPFMNSRLVEALEGEYEYDDGETIAIWIGHRGLRGLLGERPPRKPKMHQSTDYENAVSDHLWWIHHTVGDAQRRPVEFSETLHPEIEWKFRDLWGDEGLATPLRVGLFSLRGGFEPDFTVTRIEQVDDGPLYLFRAGEMRNEDGYAARIEEAVHLASDPERWIQILVFPEFMMTHAGVDALRNALRDEYRQYPKRTPPLLVFAGSLHEERPGQTAWGNHCRVFDGSGRIAWEQWKRVPYGGRGKETLFAEIFSNLPPEASGILRVHEDIEKEGGYVIGKTPLGCFAVAICSDMMLTRSDSPRVVWAEVPVDWVIIPSYTPSTKRFLDVAHDLVNAPKVILFANAFPAIRATAGEAAASPWDVTPNELADQERPVSAFISTPWVSPHALWFGREVKFQSTKGCTIAITDTDWDGLLVNLGEFLDI